MNPEFLDVEDVIDLHASLIDEYGGSHGLKDTTLLESAVGQPQAGLKGHYLHTDLFEMAAAYLFHIVKNHPFVDGNKRTGLQCALVFLEINGSPIDRPTAVLYDVVERVASGFCSKLEAAQVLRSLAES